jgi:hypothetical protein
VSAEFASVLFRFFQNLYYALADDVGIHLSYMGGIECGEHYVALVNLVKIAPARNITTAEILASAKI